MPYLFTCEHCRTQTLVDDRYSGLAGNCVSCGSEIRLPIFAQGKATLEGSPRAGVRVTPPSLGPLGRRLIAASVCIALIGCGAVAFVRYAWPQVATLQAYRARSHSIRNIERIAAAMNAYAADHGSYPPPYTETPDGRPLQSWRVLLLPYLGHQALFARFDLSEPWDAPQNMALAIEMPSVFSASTTVGGNQSNYFLITGPGTLFPPAPPRSVRPLGPGDVRDDPGQTLLVVEAQPLGGWANQWTEPLDLEVDRMRGTLGSATGLEIGGVVPGGAVVATVDGRGHFLDEQTPPVAVMALTTIAGGESLPDKLLGR
ncbi:MAG: DUF1559 domain-containing protein [Planctomycetaceae bacterium]|nr:MAG: DUF1559 domain-containing protein [Planctomycetaceae bacterium]